MSDEQEMKTCDECGASIYPEHVERHNAGVRNGKLLCPHCWAEKKALADDLSAAATDNRTPDDVIEAPIDLISEDEVASPDKPSTAIHTFGGGGITFESAKVADTELRRPLSKGSRNATRCKTFHCKLNDVSIVHMNQQMNEWADRQEDLEIKFACSNVGVMEGKHADPHLIVTVFY